MKSIKLSQGKVALVDDQDFESVSRFKWFALFDRYNWYAIRRVGEKKQSMHRFLMRPPAGVEIDHKDRNGLNNQRRNFRICTHAQNCQNSHQKKANKSGYKGVSWKKSNRKWCAQIKASGMVMHIGLFTTAKKAAMAYDAAAIKHHGDFALTNKKLGLL